MVQFSVMSGNGTGPGRGREPGRGPGQATIAGKLHYQACNNRMCLTPKTIDVSVPVEIVR